MREKIVIVGQNPSDVLMVRKRSLRRKLALGGRVGRRLAQLCDLDFADYLREFERRNLIYEYDWDQDLAYEAAIELAAELADRRVVLLGRLVARSFGVEHYDWFEWYDDLCVAPHPSGRSRWWNEEKNLKQAGEFWRGCARWRSSRRESAAPEES